MGRPKKYKTEAERKAARKIKKRITDKRYRQSEKGKATLKRWLQSENGKALTQRYKQSEKGKATMKRCKKKKMLKSLGATLDEYNQIFIEQDGCCAICGRHQSEFKKDLAVDHNRETGRVRGLLCQNCNIGLGQFHENKELFQRAINYLGVENV